MTIGDKELCALLYADDIVLTADTPEILQAMIDEVAAYTSQWRLSLNTKKTQVMVVRPSSGDSGNVEGESWLFQGKALEIVRKYKYLGVWITDNLLWGEHVKHVEEKAKKALHPLRRLFAQRQLPMPIKRQVFTSLVRSKMEYASSVWYCYSTQLRKLDSTLSSHLDALCQRALYPDGAANDPQTSEVRKSPKDDALVLRCHTAE